MRIWMAGYPLLFSALAGILAAQSPSNPLRQVATVHQFGPVGYRDPLAVVSPDGIWLATARARHVAIQRMAGGPVIELDTAGWAKSYLAWLPDSRHLAVLENAFRSDSTRWLIYDVGDRTSKPLWAGRTRVAGHRTYGEDRTDTVSVSVDQLRHLAWSPDGRRVAGVKNVAGRGELWIVSAGGDSASMQDLASPISFPAWAPDSRRIACLIGTATGQRISLPCGTPPDPAWQQDVYGPLAFSSDGNGLYYAVPNTRGTLDLWFRSLTTGGAEPITTFTRDTYAPSVTGDGSLVFKTQVYTTSVAIVPAEGGASSSVTSFMSETPSWDWTDRQLGVTYGNWRRLIDDFNYPDISQDIGTVRLDEPLPAKAPSMVVQASPSEDQGFCWSPNERWIAFHSHQQHSDDIWIEPADLSAAPRQLSRGGYETGWPRWSRDGRWIVYPTDVQVGSRTQGALYVIGINQTTGVAGVPTRVPLDRDVGEVVHGEWMPDGDHLVIEAGDPASPAKALYLVGRADGHLHLILRFRSEQLESGIGVSPDGTTVAYVAPATDGFFQIFAVPVSGGAARQVTTDPTNKTQPAWSHDGRRIAYTVWTYDVKVFEMAPGGRVM